MYASVTQRNASRSFRDTYTFPRGLIPGVVRKLFKSPVDRKQGHFYLTIYSTHSFYGYMVKDHSDSQIGNLLLPLHGLLFSISRQDSTYHGLYYTSPGTLTGLRNSSIVRDRCNDLSQHMQLLYQRTSCSPVPRKLRFCYKYPKPLESIPSSGEEALSLHNSELWCPSFFFLLFFWGGGGGRGGVSFPLHGDRSCLSP